MRNLMILAAALFVIAASMFFLNNNGPRQEIEESTNFARSIGPAPDIALVDIAGSHVRLSDFRGKAVVINFWASWCAPCVVEMPKLLAMAAQHRADMVLILLSSDDDDLAMTKFIARLDPGLSDNVVVARDVPDQTGRTLTRDVFQTHRLPETILIDAGGTMIRKIRGDTEDWTGPAMAAEIRRLAAVSTK